MKKWTVEVDCPHAVTIQPIGFIHVLDGESVTEEVIANANILAAAPDLLEACKYALNTLESHRDPQCVTTVQELRMAITKAEKGEKE